MSWEMVKLDDCLELITYGFTNPMPDADNGPWKVTAKDIIDGRINFDSARHTTQEAYEKDLTDKSRPIKDDLLLTKDGTLGRVALVGEETICINQSVALLRLKKDIIAPEYLLYLLQSSEYQGKMLADAGGSTIKHIYITKVNQMQIPLPPPETQRKLVDILQAYDKILDINQKQIKLLEEAAQRLYKEWFVDFRFPGYENTPVIDGIPQGWEQEPIDEVYSIKYGKNLPTTEISGAGKYPVYGANGVIGYYHKFNCDSYVTLITSRGNGSGDVSRTHHSNSFVTNNSFVVIPQQTHNFISNEFTYWLMKYTDFKSVCTGSAQPQLTNNSISTLKVLLPTKKLILCFCEITRMYFENVEKLLRQNRLLIEARERLLPKLMSGELGV